MQRYVKTVAPGVDFMDCFWNVEAPAVFYKRVGALNLTHYTPCGYTVPVGLQIFSGPLVPLGVRPMMFLPLLCGRRMGRLLRCHSRSCRSCLFIIVAGSHG